ncbi:hypothetical protein ACFYXC_15405 [Streptomyces sp. NPDC002701]|uniref:hypothetical protein n=1 Tax=Streptomyces sp. NPDC002701 TaxID=3364661 RepID=UPI0036C62990
MQDRPDDSPTQPARSAQPEPQAAPPPGSTAPPTGETAPRPEPAPGPHSEPQTGSQTESQTGTPPGAQTANSFGPPPAYPPPAPPYAYGQPPGFPPPSGGRGTAGRAVLWAAVGAVVASALWAGGILLLDPLGDDPDLAGYRARANLCSAVDYTSLRGEYAEEDDAPTHNALKHKALDQSYCSISLKKSASSSYSDAYLSVQMELHKETDPSAEFTALWSEYDQRYEDYDVEKVSGHGDEAYLVTEDTTSGSGTSGSRAVILAVRDGWMTYQMSWSVYTTSYGTSTPPTVDEVARWVRSDTRSTLENLRSD